MKNGKNMKILIVGFFTLMLSACLNIMTNEVEAEKTSKVIVAPLPENKRKTLAIARFTNDSNQENVSTTEEIKSTIGKQASDFLEHRLVITQQFNVMERQDIGKIKNKAKLLGKTKQYFQQNLKSVDALIVGSIVNLKKDDVENNGKGKEKNQKVYAKVSIKLINPKTGEVFFNQEGEGNSSGVVSGIWDIDRASEFNAALEEKAINSAIVNLIDEIVSALNTPPSID